MLIEFSVSNYRSFKEQQTLSMVASNDKSLDKNVTTLYPGETKSIRVLRAAAIFGANASGKSNLLRALKSAVTFVKNSATKYTLGDIIPAADPFRLDRDSRNEPSAFEFVVALADGIYEYSFACTQERVTQESLHFTPIGKGKKISRLFSRDFDPETGKYSYKWNASLKSTSKLLKDLTRDNGLVLSRAAELNVDIVKNVFRWFPGYYAGFDMADNPKSLQFITAEQTLKSKPLHQAVSSLLRSADIGFSSFEVKMEGLDGNVLKMARASGPTGAPDEYYQTPTVTTTRFHSDGEAKETFSLDEDESLGTQRLFAIAGPLIDMLPNAVTLTFDEMDSSLHPQLLRGLIELFLSEAHIGLESQLIFTTHDSSLFDQKLLRRDQLILVDKSAEQASELTSLYDYKPRNVEPVAKGYLDGRYGGVPNLGPVFEDLEVLMPALDGETPDE